jgi:hypothetical protein
VPGLRNTFRLKVNGHHGERVSKAFGNDIYSTHEITFLNMPYQRERNRKIFKVIMQKRVNPENMEMVSKAETGMGEYWISPRRRYSPYGFYNILKY